MAETFQQRREACPRVVTMKLARMRLALPILLLLSVPVAAQTVFRTVDENGVVSFSDTPPEGDAAVESITIDTPQAQSPEAAQQRLEDMRETTDRMAADRREREKHRAEMRELQARSQPPAPTTYTSDYYDYYPAFTNRRVVRRSVSGGLGYYGGTPWRPDYRPGHDRPGHDRPGHDRPGHDRPRPEHPIARPPLRPGLGYGPDYRPQPQVNVGSNSQLMRPIVSPRR